MWETQLSHHQPSEQAPHSPAEALWIMTCRQARQSTHRTCTISSHLRRSHGKASCVLQPLVIYIRFLYTKQQSWLQRNKGSGEQTAGNNQMEEDLGQPNTINLSAYCQDTVSRILGIFLSEHLGQLATQLIGAESQQWKLWKCFLPQKRSRWQCGWR